jgi:hypothetical protein
LMNQTFFFFQKSSSIWEIEKLLKTRKMSS